MSSTDNRIVRMQFDNKQFMKAAADTQKSLADTNKAVDSTGKTKGLLDLQSQMTQVGVTASKMAIATTTALATIVNKVVNVGINMAKSLTLDPLKQGFSEYESLLTKQNVIQNATGKSAKVVKSALNDLNKYSDKTIYSFGNMTDAIQKFVNAGVPLGTSVTTIKGIANAAAFAGASSEEANRAMYAFSQSMSLGFVQLQDWNQIENANLGTIKFKNSLLQAGVAAGTLTKKGDGFLTKSGKFVSATKGWRDGLQEQWATTEVLNSALGKYADTNTKLGKKAFQSAQQVRTFSAFMDTLKESIGSGWSQIFTALIGNLGQATTFWTGFSNSVGGAVKSFFKFISISLKTWRQMGGFEKTIQGFKNILAPFAALFHAIGDAMDQAFPGSNKGAGKALYGLSAGFELLTRPLAWLAKGIPAITPLLVAFFTAIRIGGEAVGDAIKYIVAFVESAVDLANIEAPNAGGFLGFIQSIVVLVQSAAHQIDGLIHKSKSLGGVFDGFSLPSVSLPSIGGGDKASAATKAVKGQASQLSAAMKTVLDLGVKIGDVFANMWDKIKTLFSGFNVDDFTTLLSTGLFAAITVSVVRFIGTMKKSVEGFAQIGPAIAETIESAGSALKSFQTQARAKLILNIGIAVGILAASLLVLSLIPAKRLASGLAALGLIFIMLNRAMTGLNETLGMLKGGKATANMIVFSFAVVALAGAMLLLALALLLMNKIKWTSIAKGLVTMQALIFVVEQLGEVSQGSVRGILGGAVAIGAIAASMVILAGALLLFKLVDWGSMGKAGAALAVVSLAVAGLALIPYEGIAKVGFALLGASVGLLAIANALIIFALVKWESIGKAAVILGALTLALAVLMAVGGPAGAASMLALSAAMVGLALACLMLNKVDWSSIAKAAVILGLLILAMAAGAAIVTLFLYVIAPLAPVIFVIAAAIALLGLGMLAFAAAMTIAMGLATAGTAAFTLLATGAAIAIGVFLQTLAAQAPIMSKSVLALLQALIDTVVQAVPMIIRGFKDLFKAIVKELSSGDKKKSFGDVVTQWLDKLDQMARKYIPKLVRLGLDVVLGFLNGLKSRVADFATMGIQFLTKLIEGIGKRVGNLVSVAVDVVIKFAQGLEKNAFRLANAGIALIAKFLHDLASAIRSGSSAIGSGLSDVIDAMRDVGVNMVKGLIGGVGSMVPDALNAIGNMAGGMIKKAKGIFKVFSPSRVFRDIGKFVAQGLAKGVQDHAASAIVAVASMVTGAIAVADDYVSKYFQKLDQQAIAARAKANGLAAAAAKAQKSANKTKTKEDDKAANRLSKRAKAARKDAKEEEQQAAAARKAAKTRETWENASNAKRAEIRSNQAQSQLAGAKAAEKDAEAARVQAVALREQAKHAGDAKQRKALNKEADRLRKQAKEEAKKANALIAQARSNSAEALKYQKLAAKDAADAYQKQYDAEAKADADAEAFDKLTDAEKAEKRRKQAVALQAKADADLKRAKELAKKDLNAANALAQQALAEAEQSRQFMDEANQFASNGSNGGTTTPVTNVINLDQSDAAAAAFNRYSDLYDASYAAAAAGQTVEFNQYNTSPESLSDADIYRNTNNQLNFAADKLAGAAA